MLRGEIWLINLDPTIGAEINKTRPADHEVEQRVRTLTRVETDRPADRTQPLMVPSSLDIPSSLDPADVGG